MTTNENPRPEGDIPADYVVLIGDERHEHGRDLAGARMRALAAWGTATDAQRWDGYVQLLAVMPAGEHEGEAIESVEFL